jgi:hypothetical protein
MIEKIFFIVGVVLAIPAAIVVLMAIAYALSKIRHYSK